MTERERIQMDASKLKAHRKLFLTYLLIGALIVNTVCLFLLVAFQCLDRFYKDALNPEDIQHAGHHLPAQIYSGGPSFQFIISIPDTFGAESRADDGQPV